MDYKRDFSFECIRGISRRAAAIYLMVLCILALISSPSMANEYRTECTILVIIDGVRYTEGLGDSLHTYVPRMWEIAQEGAIVEPFLNDGYTYTSRAIPAIWCGNWTEIYQFEDPDCGGNRNNYTRYPTIFEYFRRDLDRPEDDCIYVLKDVGCPWKASFDPEYGPEYWPRYHSQGYSDADVWEEAQAILNTDHPSLFMLYLAEVDQAGHSGNWQWYTNAITGADLIVGELWDFLETDPFYAGRTTMFVTNDHGRHTSDWTGHGCECNGCREVQLLAIGPDIPPGIVSQTPGTIRDITPTVGELMGFPTPYASGSILHEIIQSVASHEIALTEVNSLVPILEIHRGSSNEAIWFQLMLPSSGYTRLIISDILGRRLAMPASGLFQSGSHRIPWGNQLRSSGLTSSGSYIATAITPSGTASKPFILLR